MGNRLGEDVICLIVPEKQIPVNCGMIGLNMKLKPCESTRSHPFWRLFRDYPSKWHPKPSEAMRNSIHIWECKTAELFRERERYRQTETDRQTDRQTGRQADRQIDR